MADEGLKTYAGKMGSEDFSITLPSWALEATQKQVVKKLGDMDSKLKSLPTDMGKAFDEVMKGNIEELQKLNKETKQQTTQTKNQNQTDKKNQSKSQKAQDMLTQQMFNNAQALKDIEDLAKKNANTGAFGGSLMDLAGKTSRLGLVVNTVFKVMGGLAKVVVGLGGVLSTVTIAIGREFMKVFNLFNQSLRDGTGYLLGAYTDAQVNVAAQAAKAGLSLSEFVDALVDSSEELAVIGTKRFVEFRNGIRDATEGMYELGFNNEEITKLLGREIAIRQRLGMRLDIAGDSLSDNVAFTAKRMRHLGNVAGMSMENLYQAAKLEDETNTLIAARARDMGDDAIGTMRKSLNELSMRITALSPTYAQQITGPLVNAMVTGAVGLDQQFTDMVTVFPGLVRAFKLGRDEIMSTGEISGDGITRIVQTLSEVSDEEFNRAKMLALMTRNQNAIQAVNFASEARARKGLLDRINGESAERINSAATITSQVNIFLDLLKAPFETAIPNFIMSVLGVQSGNDNSLAEVVRQFSNQTHEFLRKLPIIGNAFNSTFMEAMADAIDAYFGSTDPDDKAAAAAKINSLTTDLISNMGDAFGKALRENGLAKIVTDYFTKLFDDLILNIYESSDGNLMKGSASQIYLKRGDFDKATSIDPVFANNLFENVTEDIGNISKDINQVYGLGYNFMEKMGNVLLTGPDASPVPIQTFVGLAAKGMGQMKRYQNIDNLTDAEKEDLRDRIIEYQTELLDVFKGTGFLSGDATVQDLPKDIGEAIKDALGSDDKQVVGSAQRLLQALQNDDVLDRLGTYSKQTEIKPFTYQKLDASGNVVLDDNENPVMIENPDEIYAKFNKTRRVGVGVAKKDGTYDEYRTETMTGIASLNRGDFENFRSQMSHMSGFNKDFAESQAMSFLNNEEFRKMLVDFKINDEERTRLFGSITGETDKPDPKPGMVDELATKLDLSAEQLVKLENIVNRLVDNLDPDTLTYK